MDWVSVYASKFGWTPGQVTSQRVGDLIAVWHAVFDDDQKREWRG